MLTPTEQVQTEFVLNIALAAEKSPSTNQRINQHPIITRLRKTMSIAFIKTSCGYQSLMVAISIGFQCL